MGACVCVGGGGGAGEGWRGAALRQAGWGRVCRRQAVRGAKARMLRHWKRLRMTTRAPTGVEALALALRTVWATTTGHGCSCGVPQNKHVFWGGGPRNGWMSSGAVWIIGAWCKLPWDHNGVWCGGGRAAVAEVGA